MSLNFGKPGTRRVRGLQRAQLHKANTLLNSLVQFNVRSLARTPPETFLTGPQLTTLNAAINTVQDLLEQVNV